MSFLKIGDRAAGAIKSGGTTRRAAKMVVLDLDHPDIEEFVNWKVVEEQKVAALVTGSQAAQPAPQRHPEGDATAGRTPDETLRPRTQRRPAQGHRRRPRRPGARPTTSSASIQLAKQGFTSLHIEEYDTDWNSKAYYTVSGQNSNNSVRITNDFMKAVRDGRPLAPLLADREGEGQAGGPRRRSRSKTLQARDLWDQIAYAAWSCADPGVQFDTTINEWHTCPADGRINATNPCSRIHVPRRHRLQSGVAESAQVLRRRDRHASTSKRSATPAASGR